MYSFITELNGTQVKHSADFLCNKLCLDAHLVGLLYQGTGLFAVCL